jgi:hypothetical protein
VRTVRVMAAAPFAAAAWTRNPLMLPGKDVRGSCGAEAPAEANPTARQSKGYKRARLPFTGFGLEYPTHLRVLCSLRKPIRAMARRRDHAGGRLTP